MQRTARSILCLAMAGLAAGAAAARAADVEIDSNTFGGLEARSIGPANMGGRIAAIDAVGQDPLTIYVGAAGGGVWKSTDGGLAFKPVFDDQTQSIGAIAIDPKNPKNVCVGTGESWTRNSPWVGDGLYKTADRGGGGAVADERGLRAGRIEGPRPLPLGRHRRELAIGQQLVQRAGAAVLLRPRRGRSDGPQHGLQAGPDADRQQRRRQVVQR